MKLLEKKVVLITGAARGLGQHLAVAFAEAGATVVVTARNVNSLEETEKKLKEIEASFSKAKIDVTSYEECEGAVQKAIKEHGRLDFMINNASAFLKGWDLRKLSVDEIENEINVTYRGTVFMTKAAMGHVLESKAVIVNISSIAGQTGSDSSDSTIYAADKSAVIRFSEQMDAHTKDKGMRVYCVVPGSIREESEIDKDAVSYKQVAARIIEVCLGETQQTVVVEA